MTNFSASQGTGAVNRRLTPIEALYQRLTMRNRRSADRRPLTVAPVLTGLPEDRGHDHLWRLQEAQSKARDIGDSDD